MTSPLRVAQVVGKMVGGGVESVVMNYYRHIDRERVQFDFLADADSALVPRDEIESLGGRVFEVPPYQDVLRYSNELEALFRRERWQIVHSHVNALSVFPLRAAKRAGVPVRIAHSHSTAGRGETAKNAAKRLLRTQANRYPTHRMACSRYAGEWLFGRGSGFEVLHNAIDLPRFSFDAEARARARAELGLVGGRFVVGHVGRFMPQKNHRFLIEAFSALARRREDAVLLLVGDGAGRREAEAQADALGVSGKVRFLGQRGDMWRLYQAFDAFCLPSLYEGLPVVGVEAQAAGLPCLLSDAIAREVDLTGRVRFLPIDDPEAWADALCVAAASRPADGERAALCKREAAAGLFDAYDIGKAAPKLADYYEGLAGKEEPWRMQ